MAGYRRTRLYMYLRIAVCLIVLMVIYTASSIWRNKPTEHRHTYTNNITQTSLPTRSRTVQTQIQTLRKTMAPKVLCLILSSRHDVTKMDAVNRTWARRCDKLWFILGEGKPLAGDSDNILRVDVPESRHLLTQKMIKAFHYAFEQYNDKFDWILKCDIDTYVIMENLKYLLSHLNPEKPSYLGHHFKTFVYNGYMSGGAGYVISSAALRHLNTAFQNGSCTGITEKNEDLYFGACLQNIGVPAFSSTDTNHMETFHTETLKDHLVAPYNKALWNINYSWNKPQFGEACCSPYSISFHHLKPDDILLYDHLLYRTNVFGRSHVNDSRHIFNPRRVSNPPST